MRKKRILFLTDYAGAYTGFGKQCKLLLSYLYKTNKYELLNLAQGVKDIDAIKERYPWKTCGAIPSNNPAILNRMSQDPNFARHVSYGALSIQDKVKEFKPDVIFAINDTWGSQFVTDNAFFNKIPTVCWNTFDSLPLLQETIDKANKIKNYWTWSEFAKNELHKLGFTHVKNQYPLVNTKNFFKLSSDKIRQIKLKAGLPEDSFIIGFVFRNQLRKLINTQIEAYSIFKQKNPEIKNTFLYTHTHYSEGWDIQKLCKQYGVNPKEVLCTYVCLETREYFILPFQGQNIKNPKTGNNSLITSNAEFGVTDEQLNEIYNIFSLYSHPATSGACELPCVEAALTEKIVTTCRYSFGEDIVLYNKGSIEMPFSFYTEHGTQFLKSQPIPNELAEIFKKVYYLSPAEKEGMEKESSKWALNNYSLEINGKKIEDFIDSCDLIDFEGFDFDNINKNNPNPNAIIPEGEQDDKTWVKNLYKLILDREVTDNDEGVQHWLQKIQQKVPKNDIENYFRKVAVEESAKNNQKTFEEILDNNDAQKRILVVMPDSQLEIFMLSGMLESIKDKYPENNIYVAINEKFQDLILGNPFVHKVIPYIPPMDDITSMERNEETNSGFFEIVFPFQLITQKLNLFHHQRENKIDFNIH